VQYHEREFLSTKGISITKRHSVRLRLKGSSNSPEDVSCLQIDKTRFRRYIGNIGEMIVQEVLVKRGYRVWLLTPYFPSSLKRPLQKGLLSVLQCLYEDESRTHEVRRPKLNLDELRDFFGGKLGDFKQYVERLGVVGKDGLPGAPHIKIGGSGTEYLYCPDLVAKKNNKIYVVEIKVGQGTRYLKKEKVKGLVMAKEHGFIPMLVTLNLSIEARDLEIKIFRSGC